MAARVKIMAEGHLLIKLLIDDLDRGLLYFPSLGHGAEIASCHSQSTRQLAAQVNKQQFRWNEEAASSVF